MHCSRRLQTGERGRLRLGRAGVSPLLRHSPVRAPPPDDVGGDPESALPLPVLSNSLHEVYLGNWPNNLHELEIAALFHKYSIYPKHIHLHRKPLCTSYAFVELACAEDVLRAVDQLHGGKVLGHQIVVCQSRESFRQRGQRRPPSDGGDSRGTLRGVPSSCHYRPSSTGSCPGRPHRDVELEFAVKEEEEEEEEAEELVEMRQSPLTRSYSLSMPPLVLPPPPPAQVVRRCFSDRDEELYESLMRSKRLCTRREDGVGASCAQELAEDSGDSPQHDLTQDSGSGHQSARSSATHGSVSASASDVIRRRLHQPVDVLVANFPANTAQLDLMDLFGRFKPLRVHIMVGDPGQLPGAFTYAYVTVWNTMMADSAVLDLDGRLFRGHHLVVEVRRS